MELDEFSKNDVFNDVYLNMFKSNDACRLDELIDAYSNKPSISKNDLIELLNVAVCDEILASFNYMISYAKSNTNGKADVDPEFEDHEKEELDHAHKIINRLRELSPEGEYLMTNISDYPIMNSCGTGWKQESSRNSIDILRNRWEEEKNAIKFYAFVLKCIFRMEELDTTTKSLIESIKKDEEQHELDLRDLLNQLNSEF